MTSLKPIENQNSQNENGISLVKSFQLNGK